MKIIQYQTVFCVCQKGYVSDDLSTLEFPAVETWRAQEAVLDGVEARSPRHASYGRAWWWCGSWCPGWTVLGSVHWSAFRGGEGAASRGGVRGNLYEGDRFGSVVSKRRRNRHHGVKMV